jgi:hypothetical protein
VSQHTVPQTEGDYCLKFFLSVIPYAELTSGGFSWDIVEQMINQEEYGRKWL